jgi:hypothetical protein
MSDLRIAGLIVGVLMFFAAAMLYRSGRMRRLDLLLWLFLSAGVFAVAAAPAVAGLFLNPLDFQREDNRQLLGVLVIANLILFLLYFRAAGIGTGASRDVTKLVRALAAREYRREFGKVEKSSDIIVVLAAYNEEETVGNVIERIPREINGLKVEPLVIVDGATDKTEDVAREHGVPVVLAINRGQGAALYTGYELAAERGAQIIVVTDADGQNEPEEIPRLVEPILNDEADFVNGSRKLAGGHYEREGFIRPLGVKMFGYFISLLVQRRVTDASSSFRAFRAGVVPSLTLHQDQFQASELLIEAIRKGLRFKEVPITVRRRPVGKSKKPAFHRYAFGFARAIMQTWLR